MKPAFVPEPKVEEVVKKELKVVGELAEKDKITSISWSPDGSTLAAGLEKGLILLIDPKSGKKVGKLKGHKARMTVLS